MEFKNQHSHHGHHPVVDFVGWFPLGEYKNNLKQIQESGCKLLFSSLVRSVMACSGEPWLIVDDQEADSPGSINQFIFLYVISFLVVESTFSPMFSLSNQIHTMIYVVRQQPERDTNVFQGCCKSVNPDIFEVSNFPVFDVSPIFFPLKLGGCYSYLNRVIPRQYTASIWGSSQRVLSIWAFKEHKESYVYIYIMCRYIYIQYIYIYIYVQYNMYHTYIYIIYVWYLFKHISVVSMG